MAEGAEVAVARSLRDHRSRRPDARPGDQAFVDGALQTEHRPADVAHRGEAGQQQILRAGGLADLQIVRVGRGRLCQRQVVKGRVRVRVDQPRHQRAPAAVDRRQRGVRLGRGRTRADALDRFADDQHAGRTTKPTAFAVEDAHIGEQRRRLRRRRGRGLCDGGGAEHEQRRSSASGNGLIHQDLQRDGFISDSGLRTRRAPCAGHRAVGAAGRRCART